MFMFCSNCGHKMDGTEEFCSNCGTKITKVYQNDNQKLESLKSKSRKRDLSFFVKSVKDVFYSCWEFMLQHKKVVMIATSMCIAILIGIGLFYTFYDFTKLSWSEQDGKGTNLYTPNVTLTMQVSAYDKQEKPIHKIKFSVPAGKIESKGTTVKWTLPSKAGDYTITATAPSGKKISKRITVVDLNDSNEGHKNLFGMYETSVDDKTADNDKDGIPNAQEKKLGTDPNLSDTDQDGLSDYYEIHVSKTDPLKKDTDQDGLNDGDELDLKLDPLKADSKGDGIKDSERILTYHIADEKAGVSMEIQGKGNIASSSIDVFANDTFMDLDGVLGNIYSFDTDGSIEKANVKIRYKVEDLVANGLSEDNLTLYYFNENSKKLEALPTIVNKENKQIQVVLEHFSKYVLGDSQVVTVERESDIMFVIDNSYSMYSLEQLEKHGFNASYVDIDDYGSDASFKRLTLTNKLINMFTGNYRFGVAEFSGNYVNVGKFTNNKKSAIKAVNSMKNNWNSNTLGTNIVSALKKGINEFSSSKTNNYLILFTDGSNTVGSLSLNAKTIIKNAKEKKVKVCVIGLGNKVNDSKLTEISTETGCGYYHAGNIDALDEIYSLVGASINYNYIDTDQDDKVDGIIHEDSGFIIKRDGFPFANFASNKSANGHCYGMSTFAMLYYKNQLPLSLAAKDNTRFYFTQFKTIPLASDGYDLKNTYFAQNKRLYDFKIENRGLSLILDPLPSDYRDRIENKTWMIKKEYHDELAKIGSTFSVKNYRGNDKFSKYQSALLNMDSKKFKQVLEKDEREMINAIWRLYILQADAKKITFSADPDEAFRELVLQLSNGTPVVLGINGNHAINAVRLIQDISDANKFKIEVYDNNYPGETRYITMKRSKFNKIQFNYTAWVNEYSYAFSYDSNSDGKLEDTTVQLSIPTIE